MTKSITRKDIVPLDTYREGRDEYLQKMITYKNNRRVKLSDHISILFENRNTVLFQILELVHSEDLTDPEELDEYISIYDYMIPKENELSATLFIEWDDLEHLGNLLVQLKGIENYLQLTVGDETIQAVFEEEHDDREATTSVHYLKFPLTQSAKQQLQDSADDVVVKLKLTHPNLADETVVPPSCIKSLRGDLV
ncbi:DUF3501 family protein [Ectobacillus sp. sgz5001026]|uniref:DUF3501 family protein n=1 Tax=Ectobacillus sp. sgz5001026 TaxID=3242473 RepID=UPI0036D2C9E4